MKRDRILIPVALDSTQQEALTVLKKLKVCFFVKCCQVYDLFAQFIISMSIVSEVGFQGADVSYS